MAANYTINYVNLIENILALFCQLVTIVLIGRILWGQRKPAEGRRFSSIFIFYLSAVWTMTLGCLPFRFYYIFWWNEQISGYNPWAQFWVSIGNSNYLAVSTWPAFFLTIERCLAIQIPVMAKKFKQRMLIGSIGGVIFFYGLSTATLFTFAMPNTSGNVAKFKNQAQLVIKCTSGIANLIASAIFLFLLNGIRLKNMKNRLTIVTMCCDLFMNTLPSLVNYLLITTINFGLSDYVGSFGVPLVSVDCAICALYYYKVVMHARNNGLTSSTNPKQQQRRNGVQVQPRAAAPAIDVRRRSAVMVTPPTNNIAYVF